MVENKYLGILKQVGAVLTGTHVVYASGKHGSAYINKDALYAHTWATDSVAYEIATQIDARRNRIDVVIGPAVCGAILGHLVTSKLCGMWGGDRVRSAFADKDEEAFPGSFIIKRGYDKLIKGKRVGVVEDVLTTGGSVKKVVEAVRKCGGDIIVVGAICNRGKVTAVDVGNVHELFALVDIDLDMWESRDCPLCRDGVPINTDVGHGKAFLARTKKT